MPDIKVTDDDLPADLTDGERAALLDDTIIDEGALDKDTGVRAVIPDDDNQLVTQRVITAPAPAPLATPAPVPAAAAPAAAAPAATIEPAPAAPAASTERTITAPAPQLAPKVDYGKAIDGLLGEQSALAQKFDDGDLTGAEYESQRQALDAKLFDARSNQRDSVRRDEDIAQTFYTRSVPTFIAAHPAYAEGTARFDALNGKVLKLQNAAIAAAGGDERAQYNGDLLQQAYDLVEKELGATAAATGIRPTPEDPANRVIPPNMGGAPSAATDDDITQNGRWAVLDRLASTDPEAHETAFKRLSKDDQNAYLAAT